MASRKTKHAKPSKSGKKGSNSKTKRKHRATDSSDSDTTLPSKSLRPAQKRTKISEVEEVDNNPDSSGAESVLIVDAESVDESAHEVRVFLEPLTTSILHRDFRMILMTSIVLASQIRIWSRLILRVICSPSFPTESPSSLQIKMSYKH